MPNGEREQNIPEQLPALRASLAQIADALKSKSSEKPKDRWDKFNSLSPFVTALIVAIVGGMFTYYQSHTNDLLKHEESLAADRQASQEALAREHQLQLLALQTVAQYMPYLTSTNEGKKQAAIIAIKELTGNTAMALEFAALNASPGTIRAVQQIAAQATKPADRQLASAALIELTKGSGGPNTTVLRTDVGDCGPAGSGGDEATNVLKNRTDIPTSTRDLTIDELKRLPVLDVGTKRDSWSPGDQQQVKSVGEGLGIQVQGYLTRVKRESVTTANCAFRDYVDWHLSLASSQDIDPKNAVIGVVGPRMQVLHPHWLLARLQSLAAAHALIRVTGWLFFDQQHLSQDRSDQLRFRATPWEVRPVVKIEYQQGQQWASLDNE